jgi:hypothetical protein
MTSPGPKRNRTVNGEISLLLLIADGLEGGRLELAHDRTARGATVIRASLKWNHSVGLSGVGRTPSDAVKRLRDVTDEITFTDQKASPK